MINEVGWWKYQIHGSHDAFHHTSNFAAGLGSTLAGPIEFLQRPAVHGTFQVVGGASMMALGVLTAPVNILIGGGLFVYGWNEAGAGFGTWWTGRPQENWLKQRARIGGAQVGLPPEVVEGATLIIEFLGPGAGVKATERGAKNLPKAVPPKAEVPKEVKKSSVWSSPNFERGKIIEDQLGRNLPRAFPGIDRFDNGVATSIKSIDLGTPTYKNANQLRAKIRGYISDLLSFRGVTYAGITVDGDSISGRVLRLAIPKEMTDLQRKILNEMREVAAHSGIRLELIMLD